MGNGINREEYIDVNDALKRVGGNMNLYKRLLAHFAAENHIDPLNDVLESGDKEEAARLIHTLKGVAANLSLIKLMSVSAELELKIKNDLDHSECFAELKQVYYITSELIAEVS